jgi:hypothetical protein
MAEQIQPIDISNQPDLVRLAEEVRTTRKPRLLRHNGEDVAVLKPTQTSAHRTPRSKLFTENDALFRLIGTADGPEDGVTDVSENVDRYLADAYSNTNE